MIQSMPVKLSGALVADARKSAKALHRSLTGQIEHWASLGRAVESQLPGDALVHLLDRIGGTMKISQVAEASQRQEVTAALAEFLGKPTDTAWLREVSARGVPLYGTVAGAPGRIERLNPDGSREIVRSPSIDKPRVVG
ncbi:MAG: TA system antitoxin ParD family protein [Opitutaceae bacterium]